MTLFVGLDVSVKETAVCVVDDTGKVVCEQKVPTEPDDIVRLLASIGEHYGRIGIEAGPLSQWLVNGLATAGLPVVCVETDSLRWPVGEICHGAFLGLAVLAAALAQQDGRRRASVGNHINVHGPTESGRVASGQGKSAVYMAAHLAGSRAFQSPRLKRWESSA